ATLGDSLALFCESTSASGFVGRTFDVGAYEKTQIVLVEVDPQGRNRRREVFATGQLGHAVVRLYERYAELLPDGPARARAAATARAAAALMVGPYDPDRHATACAPAVEVVDHRILGTWSARCRDAFLQNLRSWLAIAEDIVNRVDDVLAQRPDAILARWTHLGTNDASGGAYERPYLALQVFGVDGLVTRWEIFDADRDAGGLARFDELTGGPSATAAPFQVTEKRARRIRPNAATAYLARFNAAIAARDTEALSALVSDDTETLDHPTGSAYGRDGFLASWHAV